MHGLSGTPFRVGGVAFIGIEKETPRNERFSNIGDEERLLALADPRMRAFITTMLDTCTRPGELRTLQWTAVDLERRIVKLKAAGRGQRAKTKTQVGSTVPLSARAVALLELRHHLPDGDRMPDTSYVFGDEVGEEMSKHVLRNAWERLRDKAAQVWKGKTRTVTRAST